MRRKRWFWDFQKESPGGQTGWGEDAGQVCILNRMRLGKLIKVASGLNWEKPEEAGSQCGGQELKDISRLQRKRSRHQGYCGRESSEDFSAFSNTSQDLHLSLSFHQNQMGRALLSKRALLLKRAHPDWA